VSPPARDQSEDFFVPDPIDHLLHLADDGSAQLQGGGNMSAVGVADDPVKHVVAEFANDSHRGSKDIAPSHDADRSYQTVGQREILFNKLCDEINEVVSAVRSLAQQALLTNFKDQHRGQAAWLSIRCSCRW
jgi:hypothetical protein